MIGSKKVSLGRGYNSVTADLRNDALKPAASNTVTLSGSKKFFDIELVTAASEYRQMLGISAAASFGTLVEGVDAKVQFESEYDISSFKQSLVVRVIVRFEPVELTPQEFDDGAEEFLKNAGTSDFFKTYGDTYVSDITYGGELYAWIEFETKNRAEHEALGAQLKLSVGMFSSEASFSQSLSRFAESATSQLKVIKNGGNPTIPSGDQDHDFASVGEFIRAGAAFPGELTSEQTVVVIDWAHTDYYGAKRKTPHLEMPDVSAALKALEILAAQRDALQLLARDLDYVLQHPTEFKPFDSNVAQQSRLIVDSDLTAVKATVETIRQDPFGAIQLPQLHYGGIPTLPTWYGDPQLAVTLQMGSRKHVLTKGRDKAWVGVPTGPYFGGIAGLQIQIDPPIPGLSIHYSGYFAGWLPNLNQWASGTDGQAIAPPEPDIQTFELNQLKIWLEGPLAQIFLVKYKGHVFGGGETALAQNGVLLQCPRVPGFWCKLGCDDGKLHAIFDGTYFERLWIELAYNDSAGQVMTIRQSQPFVFQSLRHRNFGRRPPEAGTSEQPLIRVPLTQPPQSN